MRKYTSMVLAAVLAFSVGCDLGGGADSGIEPDSGISTALLSFPSSLSSSGSRGIAGRTASSTVLAELNGLYSPVRDFYNPLAEAAIELVKNYLDAVETNIIENEAMQEAIAVTGEWTGDDESQNQHYEVVFDDTAQYEYSLEIYDTSTPSNILILVMHFTETSTATGKDYEGYTLLRDIETDVAYRVNFNTNDPVYGNVTELLIDGLADLPDADPQNTVDRIWLRAWQEGTDFFVNANISYLNVDIEPDTADHSLFYDYVMGELEGTGGQWDGTTAFDGSYVYRCVAKTDSDVGAVSLGLVDDAETETAVGTLFADYSIGQIYQNAITEWFNVTDGDYGDSTVVDDMTNIGFAASVYNTQANPIIAGNLLPSEVMQYLTEYKAFFDAAAADGVAGAAEAAASLEGIIFVTDLTNPGYFDSSGFQGTSSDNTRTPSWVSDLPAETGDIAYSPVDIAGSTFEAEFAELFN